MCVAFAGSNSDVSLSDRIPILPQEGMFKGTHEDACKGHCASKSNVRKMMRITQRAQAMTSGYVGGYMAKAQPAGHLEAKKCVDKMYRLRESLCAPKSSPRQRQRAVSGRTVTDLEMNGVYRRAVELFNLTSNLRRNDPFSFECIRTFPTRSMDTQPFFHRLRACIGRDIYGFRRLEGTPFAKFLQ